MINFENNNKITIIIISLWIISIIRFNFKSVLLTLILIVIVRM